MKVKVLDFAGAIAAVQSILGRVVIVVVGNFEVPLHEGVTGFAGPLAYGDRPGEPNISLLRATDDDQIYTFFVGPRRAAAGGWFTLDERTFVRATRSDGGRPEYEDQLVLTTTGLSVIVSVPTDAWLGSVDYEPPE